MLRQALDWVSAEAEAALLAKPAKQTVCARCLARCAESKPTHLASRQTSQLREALAALVPAFNASVARLQVALGSLPAVR